MATSALTVAVTGPTGDLGIAIVNALERPWLFPQALNIVAQAVAEKAEYGRGVDPRELCNLRYASFVGMPPTALANILGMI